MVGIREGGGGGREEWCGGCEKERVVVDGGLGFGAVTVGIEEIGRASCRDRVFLVV